MGLKSQEDSIIVTLLIFLSCSFEFFDPKPDIARKLSIMLSSSSFCLVQCKIELKDDEGGVKKFTERGGGDNAPKTQKMSSLLPPRSISFL